MHKIVSVRYESVIKKNFFCPPNHKSVPTALHVPISGVQETKDSLTWHDLENVAAEAEALPLTYPARDPF